MLIGIISDTHSYMDDRILEHLADCDEIWHAGDVGDAEVLHQLKKIAPLKGVYGNIDGTPVRNEFPEELLFTVEGVKVWMIHIGGYPPKYTSRIKKALAAHQPQLFICGHSHILKVIPDQERKLLHINPGAAGRHGFHHMRTLIKLQIENGKMSNLQVVELGKRSAL